MKLWLGYTYNQKYEIQETGNYETLEQRITLMGTFSQNLPKGSMLSRHVLKLSFLMTRMIFQGPYRESG
jgi:hypothetical protein